MNLFAGAFRSPQSAIRIIRGPELLSEDKLTAALGVPLEQPQLRALMQLIGTAEANANQKAADEPANREKYVGGAEQLRLLLDEIIIRRDLALKQQKRG